MNPVIRQYLNLNPRLADFEPTEHSLLWRRRDSQKPTGAEKFWILTGPGGSGKDTILNTLIHQQPKVFRKGVTSTTRAKRPGEKDGFDYYFLTEKEFHQTKHLESNLFNYAWYGIPTNEIEKAFASNQITLFRVDINGLKSLKRTNLGKLIVSFFILPEDFAFLEEHYQGRENPKERMKIARKEIAQAHACDYVIINPRGKQKMVTRALISLVKG